MMKTTMDELAILAIMAMQEEAERKAAQEEKGNPYWERITELANAQRNKGLQKYGVALEDSEETVHSTLEHLQEELIDALMYVEHIKTLLGGK